MALPQLNYGMSYVVAMSYPMRVTWVPNIVTTSGWKESYLLQFSYKEKSAVLPALTDDGEMRTEDLNAKIRTARFLLGVED